MTRLAAEESLILLPDGLQTGLPGLLLQWEASCQHPSLPTAVSGGRRNSFLNYWDCIWHDVTSGENPEGTWRSCRNHQKLWSFTLQRFQ